MYALLDIHQNTYHRFHSLERYVGVIRTSLGVEWLTLTVHLESRVLKYAQHLRKWQFEELTCLA